MNPELLLEKHFAKRGTSPTLHGSEKKVGFPRSVGIDFFTFATPPAAKVTKKKTTKKKSKSTVNKAGNYTKPTMRKRLFNRIKSGSKGGAAGQWSARKAQMLAKAYKKAGGGYRK